MRKFLYTCAIAWLSSAVVTAEAWYSAPLKAQELMFGNALAWTTIWEINVKQFVVEKSVDGFSYDEIGTLDASGFSNIDKSYHFMDVNPLGDVSYYRLKEIGQNGKFSYSAITTVEKKLTNDLHMLSMSSVHASSEFVVKFDALRDLEAVCTLKNLDGKVLDTFQKSMKNGLNEVKVDLKQRSAGVYFLQVKNGDEIENFTILRTETADTKLPPVADVRNGKQRN